MISPRYEDRITGVVMKSILSLLALAAPASATASEVAVDSFSSDGPAGFSLLVPSAPAPPSSIPDLADQLAATFDVSAPVSSHTIEPPDDIYLPHVPTWMRAGRSGAFQPAVSFSSGVVDPACGKGAFFQRPEIGNDAQARRSVYFGLIVAAACDAGVPVRLFDALISQESRYRPFARSHAGAMGLSQLMPGTARYLGVRDPWNPEESLRAGARYLRQQLDRFGSWELALAAYNAGPGRINQYGGIPPFRETRNYVRTIMSTVDSGPISASLALRTNPFRRVSFSSFADRSDVPED